jgi:predicted dinucleotide-binding enzyme
MIAAIGSVRASTASPPPDRLVDDLKDDSGSEIVARLAPNARVVMAFNTLTIAKMFAPLLAAGLKRVLFIAGDHTTVVAAVAGLAPEIGLAPFVTGPLTSGGRQMELGGPFSGLELLTEGDRLSQPILA